ncbi:MAG: 3'-5' exonuclease [Oleispira sp.]|nr:3'-5' exonuclease [Oleispira sp.]MBL4881193.1 3'-5' exonuclease [Oleispira sp.]
MKKTAFSTQDHAQYIIENCIVIDTETTGLEDNDIAIELAAADAKTGTEIIDTLIHCEWGEVPAEAFAVHGIGIKDLKNAPRAASVIAQLTNAASNNHKQITAYNIHFDNRMLLQTAEANDLCNERIEHAMGAQLCIMELANRHFLKDYGVWKHGHSQFSRLSLVRCCEIAGIKFQGKAHRAMSDVRASIDLLHFIANDR